MKERAGGRDVIRFGRLAPRRAVFARPEITIGRRSAMRSAKRLSPLFGVFILISCQVALEMMVLTTPTVFPVAPRRRSGEARLSLSARLAIRHSIDKTLHRSFVRAFLRSPCAAEFPAG